MGSITGGKTETMNLKKITSMTMIWSLIILILNSVVLYIVPEGRISYWADWRFLGLTKTDWSAQHITVGVLFLLAGFLHIYYNWKPILAYMKNKARKFSLFSLSSSVGLVLTALFVVGTYLNVPPLSTIVDFSEYFKYRAEVTYGNPPYGQAQSSSLQMFTSRLGLDLNKSIELLGAAGVSAPQKNETIRALAERSSHSPQEIYEIIQPATLQATVQPEAVEHAGVAVPATGKSGMGRKTVAQVCDEIKINCDEMILALDARGIRAEQDAKLKDLAAENNTGPMQIYETMLKIATPKTSQ
jgi:hypothetical protein